MVRDGDTGGGWIRPMIRLLIVRYRTGTPGRVYLFVFGSGRLHGLFGVGSLMGGAVSLIALSERGYFVSTIYEHTVYLVQWTLSAAVSGSRRCC